MEFLYSGLFREFQRLGDSSKAVFEIGFSFQCKEDGKNSNTRDIIVLVQCSDLLLFQWEHQNHKNYNPPKAFLMYAEDHLKKYGVRNDEKTITIDLKMGDPYPDIPEDFDLKNPKPFRIELPKRTIGFIP